MIRKLPLRQQAKLKQKKIKEALKEFKNSLSKPEILLDNFAFSPITEEVRYEGKIYHVYR